MMNKRKPTTHCVVDGTPGVEPAAAWDRETRTDSVARLLDAFDEYERTVSLLRATVLGLCLPGMDRGTGDADGSRANRTGDGNRPNG